MNARVYLDWNATAPLRPQARAATLAALDSVGNASSVHREGRQARELIERAREQVAALVGAKPINVVFTSGGAEANALALTPRLEAGNDGRIRERLKVSAIEHPTVLGGGRFAPAALDVIPVTATGEVDLERFGLDPASAGPSFLTSVMLANNETGVVQPIGAIAERAHAAGGLMHADAVQAAGKLPICINSLGADLLTVSSHKIGGPQGAGALIRRDEALHMPDPLIKGGGQERGMRAGTENVAAIVGFGAAAEAAAASLRAETVRLAALQSRLEMGLRAIAPDAVIFGENAQRVPNTTLFAVPSIKAETALIALDLDGVAVSSGSACSSGKVGPSHVLAAMGVRPELAGGAVRVSTGYGTQEKHVDRFLEAWRRCVAALRKDRPAKAA